MHVCLLFCRPYQGINCTWEEKLCPGLENRKISLIRRRRGVHRERGDWHVHCCDPITGQIAVGRGENAKRVAIPTSPSLSDKLHKVVRMLFLGNAQFPLSPDGHVQAKVCRTNVRHHLATSTCSVPGAAFKGTAKGPCTAVVLALVGLKVSLQIETLTATFKCTDKLGMHQANVLPNGLPGWSKVGTALSRAVEESLLVNQINVRRQAGGILEGSLAAVTVQRLGDVVR